MKVAIMQPYFLPYLGYFQLIEAVDRFVVYDNIEYTKKGWINRNRMLVNGRDELFSLPLKKDSDYLDIKERTLADTFAKDGQKLLNKIRGAYGKAPHFQEVFPIVKGILEFEDSNLFSFLLNSLERVNAHLGLQTELVVSSTLDVDHSLKAQDRVIAICKHLGGAHYVNPPGGIDLYDREVFKNEGLELSFLQPSLTAYPQRQHDFVPGLSILDVMMFNSKERIAALLDQYSVN